MIGIVTMMALLPNPRNKVAIRIAGKIKRLDIADMEFESFFHRTKTKVATR